MDVRVTRLWEQLYVCREQAGRLCQDEPDAGLAAVAGHVQRALMALWDYLLRAGGPADRAVLVQLGRAGEAVRGGDPPAPERPVPGPAEEITAKTPRPPREEKEDKNGEL
jgi:hypothetical protein